MNNSPTCSILTFVVGLLLTIHAANANTMSWVNVPIPPGTAVINPASEPAGLTTLDGYQSWDLTLDTTSDWTAADLIIELSAGAIFQEGEGFGANGVLLGQPDPGGFGPLPSSEFDSYIFDPHGGAVITGPAHDLGIGEPQFDSVALDIGWNSAGTDTADVGIYSIARITLSPDALGTWSVRFTVAGQAGAIESTGTVVNGALIPEPAMLTLLALSCGALLPRRNPTLNPSGDRS